MMNPMKVVAFYEFALIKDPKGLRQDLLSLCQNIKGTILIAHEGINATVCGEAEDIDALVAHLSNIVPAFNFKFSEAPQQIFYRLKIKIKDEIVTLRQPNADPNKQRGVYVEPEDWNTFITQPDVICIDVRNTYEYKVGTFKGAINPETDTFTAFPDFIKKDLRGKEDCKLALFCTGGIRVEKASAYLCAMGYKHVYQLHGGILKYLEEIPSHESLWVGECFVFDQRVTVKQDVKPGTCHVCFGCRHPLTAEDMMASHYEAGVSCLYCYENQTPTQRRRFRERQNQITLAKKRGGYEA